MLEGSIRPRVQTLLQEAKGGDHKAQYLVGMAYLTGDRVEVNTKKAVVYLSSAASAGVAEAQVHLGLILLRGDGVARNAPQGISLIGSASERAAFDADQSYEIGKVLLAEQGEAPDQGRECARWAAHYFGAAAEEAHPQASYEVGRLLLFGRGVERDPEKAAEWVSSAANQGSRDAQYLMGTLLQSGTGVERNPEWAAHWFMEAARRGCEDSGRMLQGSGKEQAHLEMIKIEFSTQPRPARKAFVQELLSRHRPDWGGNDEIFRWAQSLYEKKYK